MATASARIHRDSPQDDQKAGQGAAKVKPVKELILPGESFLVAGRPAFILTPADDKRRTPQPWIFYAPTLPAVIPIRTRNGCTSSSWPRGLPWPGSTSARPTAVREAAVCSTEFYRELTARRGFATRPCLLGRSRGGLWVASWAAEHPDKVAGIAGIYPVFDLRTYPRVDKAAPAYGLTPKQLEARLLELNPIERVGVLAKHRVPAFLIHGDDDKVVPLKENSAEFAARYQAAGCQDAVTLIRGPGQGHNFWEGFFRCRELVDFAIDRARAGAVPPSGT